MILKIVLCCVICCSALLLQAVGLWQPVGTKQSNDFFTKLHKPRMPEALQAVIFDSDLTTPLWQSQPLLLNSLENAENCIENRRRAYENSVLDAIWKNRAILVDATLKQHLQAKQDYADRSLKFMAELACYQKANFQQINLMQESWPRSRH